MNPLIGGALIGAGSSLLGGMLGSKSQKKANQQNIDALKYGLGWKIQDAKNHGIHPLAAIGAPTTSGNAVSVGDYGVGSAGRAVGSAVGRGRENLLQKAQILESDARTRLINKQADQVELDMINSTLARNKQNGNVQQDAHGNEIVTPQTTHGLNIESDVQNIEDKYGEVISLPAGVIKAVKDAGKIVPEAHKVYKSYSKFPPVNYTYKNGKKVYDKHLRTKYQRGY